MRTFKFTFFQLFFLSLCLSLVLLNNNLLSQCPITAIIPSPTPIPIGSGSEGYVYINPGAPKEALTAELTSDHIINVYNTLDFGGIWKNKATIINVGDPSVVIDALTGKYYVAYISSDRRYVDVVISNNQGGTWSDPIWIYYADQSSSWADKPFLCIDNGNSLYSDHLYCAWSKNVLGGPDDGIWFRYSSDGGNTWVPQPPFPLIDNGNTGNAENGSVIQTGSDGNVYVAWTEFTGTTWQNIYINVSTDGGVDWVYPTNNPYPAVRSSNIGLADMHYTGAGPSMVLDNNNNIYLFWSSEISTSYSVNCAKGTYSNGSGFNFVIIPPISNTSYNYIYPWASYDPNSNRIACIYRATQADPSSCTSSCIAGTGISISCDEAANWVTPYQESVSNSVQTWSPDDYIGISYYHNVCIGVWNEIMDGNFNSYSHEFEIINPNQISPLIISGGETVTIPDSIHLVFNVPGTYMKIDDGGIPGAIDTILLGRGSTIEFYNGAYLSASNCVFMSLDSGLAWNGIIINNSAGDTITNCIFNCAETSISISDTGDNAASQELIRGNTFNISSNPNQLNYGIFASNLINATIDSNTFNLANNIGIWFENDDNLGYSQSSDLLNITNNVFNQGHEQIVLNCLASDLTPFYVAGNTFNGPGDNNCIGFWGRKISGSFKNNTFLNNYYNNSFMIYQSNMNVLNNNPILSNSGTSIFIGNSSTAQIAPEFDENNNLIWYGGMNNVTSDNNDNIYFDDGSFPITDLGQNCFNLINNINHYNIEGIQNTALFGPVYNTTQNSWTPHTPLFNIVDDITNLPIPVSYNPANSNCGTNNLSIIGYIVNNRGNGIYDSIMVTSNYNPPISGGGDGALYSQSLMSTSSGNYSSAINSLSSVLNNYDTSIYLLPSLDKMYLNYQYLDSSSSLSQRITLFTNLKNYLEAKITQHQNNLDFVVKAYDGYLMCLTKVTDFQEAIAGYENIMQNDPDTLRRLFASWDRSAVILLMNGGGGGDNDLNSTDNYKTILKDKPVHQIAMETFSKKKKAIEIFANNNSLTSRNHLKQDNARINQKIVKFNPSNHKELHIKIAEDFKVLSGNKGNSKTNAKVNNIPKVFTLYQNYPNPFNPTTKIKFDLPRNVNVTIKIYDVLGREVTTLLNNEYKLAGTYEIQWNGSNFASGVYFYRIQAGDFIAVKKMVLIK